MDIVKIHIRTISALGQGHREHLDNLIIPGQPYLRCAGQADDEPLRAIPFARREQLRPNNLASSVQDGNGYVANFETLVRSGQAEFQSETVPWIVRLGEIKR